EDWANANIDRNPLDVIFEGVPLAAEALGIPQSATAPDYVGHADPEAFDSLANTPVDQGVEKALTPREDGNPLTVREALRQTPVVAANVDSYAANIAAMEKAIALSK